MKLVERSVGRAAGGEGPITVWGASALSPLFANTGGGAWGMVVECLCRRKCEEAIMGIESMFV